MSIDLNLHRSCYSELPRQTCALALFDNVIALCEKRIHGRLESRHWERPLHRKDIPKRPLYLTLGQVLETLQGPKVKGLVKSEELLSKLQSICKMYQDIDNSQNNTSSLTCMIRDAVQLSHDVCTQGGTCSFEGTVRLYGFDPKVVCDFKAMRQIDKIGRYWGLCLDLAENARTYRHLFQKIEKECLTPYEGVDSGIFFKQTHKPVVSCHVHAEIQLLVFLDNKRAQRYFRPRVIGVSKAACYLCNLFIRTHSRYFITKTHGQLHDQWTLPDLRQYTVEQCDHYRKIIKLMDAEIQAAVKRQPKRKRQQHFGSWLTLPNPSARPPTPSDAATIVSATDLDKPQSSALPPRQLADSGNYRESRSNSTVMALPEQVQTSPLPNSDPPCPRSAYDVPASYNSSMHTLEGLHAINASTSLMQDAPSDVCSSTSTLVLQAVNLPVEKVFTGGRSLHFAYPGVYLIVEIEDPCKARIVIKHASAVEEGITNTVNIDKMQLGDERSLERQDNGSVISVLLPNIEVRSRNGTVPESLKLELIWLS